MRAAVFDAFGGPIRIETVPDPVPPDGGAVIQVGANGVCRSDWHGWRGHDPAITLPHVPGHELAGTVVAVGSGVEHVQPGERVTMPFVLACGSCASCDRGDQQVCERQYQPGFDGWGAFAEFVAVPYADGNLVRIPDELSFTSAASLGCRFATAYRAVVDQGGVGPGTSVAVWGCGGVGLSAIMIAAELGAQITAIDIDAEPLEAAVQMGAHHVVDASVEDDPALRVQELTGGVDVSIDALGSAGTAVASMHSLRRRGRHVQVGLMVGDDAEPSIPLWQLHAYEIELVGSHGMQAHRYPEMLAKVASGRLRPDLLVSSVVNLEGGVEHLEAMDSFHGVGLVVIDDFAAPSAGR